MNKYLNHWEEKTAILGDYFVEKYFGEKGEVEYYWIADDIGGVLSVADYFFNLSDIVDFIKYHYTRKLMFEYYDYALEYYTQKKHKKDDYLINIKNYKKLIK